MASMFDICNRALGEIGSRATLTSFSDGSPASFQCQLNYDKLRKLLIRCAPWNFTRRQVNLSLLGTAPEGLVPFPWMFKYLYPPDCIKFRYMLEIPNGWPFPTGPDAPPQTGDNFFICFPVSRRGRFLVANDVDENGRARKVLLSNVCQAIGVYSVDETNVDLFDAGFEDGLVALLAEKIVIPLTGNAGMKGSFMQIAKERVTEARAMDGNEALPNTDHVPDWIQARGYGSDNYYSGPTQFGPGIIGESWENGGWGE